MHIPGLPIPRTPLVGRERELEATRQILTQAEVRLLTLTGVGGGGKSRLAYRLAAEIAPDYPDRMWVVEFAPVRDPDLISSVVASTVGLQDTSPDSSLAALTGYLRDRPALLLLDNCEHLIEGCAIFVDELLNACPQLRVLATSREPLHLIGERQFRVPPLDVPNPDAPGSFEDIAASPAVRLLVSRAQAVRESFQLTPDNAITILRICARLGGIPLALELAAAQMRVLGIEQILNRLNEDFHLLSGDSRVAPTRHQTLHAALSWSEALLTATERAVFRYLSVFTGEFQLYGVAALCAELVRPPETVLEVLTNLVDKSLIVASSEDYLAWYHMLEPLRQFALEGLTAQGEIDEARARHAAYYLDLAERSAAELRGPEQHIWLRGLEREHGNMRVALQWAREQKDGAFELRLATAIAPFWETRGHLREGMRRLHGALEREASGGDAMVRVRALVRAGRLSHLLDQEPTSRFKEAERFFSAGYRLARETGDDEGLAIALENLGLAYRSQGELERAVACIEEALRLFRARDDEHATALALLHLGTALHRQGQLNQATGHVAESLDRLSPLKDQRFIAHAQMLLGKYAQERGDLEEAVQLIVEALATHLRLGIRWMAAEDLLALSGVLLDARLPEQSTVFMAAAQALSDGLGSPVAGAMYADTRARVDALKHETWFEATWSDGYALENDELARAANTVLAELDVLTTPEKTETPALTPRELEVAGLLAEGHTDREIADQLYIAVGTVGVHVHNILQKLELRSRVQVAGWLESQTATR